VVVRDSSGERVGEEEGVAWKLTEGSIRAEEGRERGLDGEGRSSGGGNGGRVWREADSAGERLEWARGRVEEAKGEAREALA